MIFLRNKTIISLLLVFVHVFSEAQVLSSDQRHKNRKWVLAGVNVGLWGGSYYALNKSWYSNQQRTAFHLYNDWGEWQQMDKLGHMWSSYQIADQTSKIWHWAGVNQKKSIVIGSFSSMAYLSIPDMLANSAGALTHLSQGILWKDQRIRIKMSYTPYRYGSLDNRADQLFGKNNVEKLLKDYNGQTYWASINVRSFFTKTKFPAWLNLAVGYGARTMLGGYTNSWVDNNGMLIVRDDIPRYRRIYVSLDIDLSKIKTKSPTLNTIFSLVNVLKLPAPAIEFNTLGKTRFHPIFY